MLQQQHKNKWKITVGSGLGKQQESVALICKIIISGTGTVHSLSRKQCRGTWEAMVAASCGDMTCGQTVTKCENSMHMLTLHSIVFKSSPAKRLLASVAYTQGSCFLRPEGIRNVNRNSFPPRNGWSWYTHTHVRIDGTLGEEATEVPVRQKSIIAASPF